VFRRIYQNMPHWREQIVAGTMTDVLTTPEGEEIYYNDLLVGLDTLPPRQRQAFELICLQGYTETAAAKIMLPNSRWSTTVQQHVNAALERMVARYDDQQSGLWGLIKRWRALMALHPIVESHLKEALKTAKKDIVEQIRPLQEALGQVDQMLRGEPVVTPSAPAEVEGAGVAESGDEG
jgi:hypothetical protein